MINNVLNRIGVAQATEDYGDSRPYHLIIPQPAHLGNNLSHWINFIHCHQVWKRMSSIGKYGLESDQTLLQF